MNKKLIDTSFVLLMLFIYILIDFLFFFNNQTSMYNMILTGLVIFLIIISYLQGMLPGLLTSFLLVFGTGAYIIFLSITQNYQYGWKDYFWIVALPLASFISGTIKNNVRVIEEKNNLIEEANQELATRDILTGFRNEKLFYIELDEEMSLSRRQEIDLVLTIIKIKYYRQLLAVNGSKKVNNIVKKLAESIEEITRKEDRHYRLDDETFAVVMPYCKKEYIYEVKNRIKNKLASLIIYNNETTEEYNLDFKISMLAYNKDIQNPYQFKEKADKELEFDV